MRLVAATPKRVRRTRGPGRRVLLQVHQGPRECSHLPLAGSLHEAPLAGYPWSQQRDPGPRQRLAQWKLQQALPARTVEHTLQSRQPCMLAGVSAVTVPTGPPPTMRRQESLYGSIQVYLLMPITPCPGPQQRRLRSELHVRSVQLHQMPLQTAAHKAPTLRFTNHLTQQMLQCKLRSPLCSAHSELLVHGGYPSSTCSRFARLIVPLRKASHARTRRE